MTNRTKQHQKILDQAIAIQELERLANACLPQRFILSLEGSKWGQQKVEKLEGVDNPGHNHWMPQLVNDIFRPLLSQGLTRYKEELKKIIDGKEE